MSSSKASTSRPPLMRMMRFHEHLKENHYPNCRSLAEEFEVSSKTIQRDLDFMRDQLGLPIEYDSSHFGYRYTEPVASFPTVQVTEGELVALFVAQKALAQYRGTAFEKPLSAAFEKLTEGLQDHISFQVNNWESFFSFKTAGATIADLKLFEIISAAVMKSQELTFQYLKLNSKKAELRHVHPYHLASVENQWYLFAYDLARKSIRTFALPRMNQAKVLKKHFSRPADFALSDFLKNSFGVYSGSETHQVNIHFDSWAARLIKERQWHPSQQIKDLPDGSIEISFTLGSLPEIERWILSWGEHAKVLNPKKLKNRIKKSAQKILEN